LWLANKASVPASYPSEAEVQAAYQANQQALTSPTQYRLAQIFISAPDGGDPAKLSAALAKTSSISSKIAGTDFSSLARAQSEDTKSAGAGGDLGYLAENRLLPSVASVVRTLKTGQIAGPLKIEQGIIFVKLLDRKTGAVPTLAEAHDRIVNALRTQRATQLAQAYLTNNSAKLSVTVNQIALARLQQTLPR
jgi:peptidylprolyl isomerase